MERRTEFHDLHLCPHINIVYFVQKRVINPVLLMKVTEVYLLQGVKSVFTAG